MAVPTGEGSGPARDRTTTTPKVAAETRIENPREPRLSRGRPAVRSALQQRQVAEGSDHGVGPGATHKIPLGRQVRRKQAGAVHHVRDGMCGKTERHDGQGEPRNPGMGQWPRPETASRRAPPPPTGRAADRGRWPAPPIRRPSAPARARGELRRRSSATSRRWGTWPARRAPRAKVTMVPSAPEREGDEGDRNGDVGMRVGGRG